MTRYIFLLLSLIPLLGNAQYKVSKLDFTSDKFTFSPALIGQDLFVIASRSADNRRNKFTENRNTDLNELTQFDIYKAKKDSVSGQFIGLEIYNKAYNTPLNEGPFCVFNNNKNVVFTKNITNKLVKSSVKNKKGFISYTGLYMADINDDGEWVKIKPIRFNNSNYNVGHPAVINDQYLVFMSQANTGMGKADLYYSVFDQEKQIWSEPINIGSSINSAENEAFPTYSQNGYLYFASDNPKSLGGFDIFYSKVSLLPNEIKFSDKFTILGDLNSKDSEIGLIFTNELATTGYFSRGTSNVGELVEDIFEISAPNGFLTEVKPIIITIKSDDGTVLQRSLLHDINDVVLADDIDNGHVTITSFEKEGELSYVLEGPPNKKDFIKRYYEWINSTETSPLVTQSDAIKPDVTEADATKLDATEADATKPDVTEADATKPDVTEADATKLDATEADATKPDVTEADATKLDATEADATKPNVTEADATKLDATEADATEADAIKPDVTEADATEADATEPDAIKPDVTEADATEADTTEADATKPNVTVPNVTVPNVTKPNVTVPIVIVPNVTKPNATEPNATKLDVTEADAIKPDATEADSIKPDATEADSIKPDATEADSIKPDATEADAIKTDVTEADATESNATESGTSEPDPIEPDPIEPDVKDTVPAGDEIVSNAVKSLAERYNNYKPVNFSSHIKPSVSEGSEGEGFALPTSKIVNIKEGEKPPNKSYKYVQLANGNVIEIESGSNMQELKAIPVYDMNKNNEYVGELVSFDKIYFDFNSYKINDSAGKYINGIIEALELNDWLNVVVTTHADSRGTKAYNQALTDKRAKTIKNLFQKANATVPILKSVGETQLRNKCSDNVVCTEEEHTENRIAEFSFITK